MFTLVNIDTMKSSGSMQKRYDHIMRRHKNYKNKNIDLEKSRFNEYADFTNGLSPYEFVENVIKDNDFKINKNQNLLCSALIEFIPEFDKSELEFLSQEDYKKYLLKAKDLLLEQKRFSDVKVLNYAIHFDETTPHLHLTFIPIVDKSKMQEKELLDEDKIKIVATDTMKNVKKFIKKKYKDDAQMLSFIPASNNNLIKFFAMWDEYKYDERNNQDKKEYIEQLDKNEIMQFKNNLEEDLKEKYWGLILEMRQEYHKRKQATLNKNKVGSKRDFSKTISVNKMFGDNKEMVLFQDEVYEKVSKVIADDMSKKFNVEIKAERRKHQYPKNYIKDIEEFKAIQNRKINETELDRLKYFKDLLDKNDDKNIDIYELKDGVFSKKQQFYKVSDVNAVIDDLKNIANDKMLKDMLFDKADYNKLIIDLDNKTRELNELKERQHMLDVEKKGYEKQIKHLEQEKENLLHIKNDINNEMKSFVDSYEEKLQQNIEKLHQLKSEIEKQQSLLIDAQNKQKEYEKQTKELKQRYDDLVNSYNEIEKQYIVKAPIVKSGEENNRKEQARLSELNTKLEEKQNELNKLEIILNKTSDNLTNKENLLNAKEITYNKNEKLRIEQQSLLDAKEDEINKREKQLKENEDALENKIQKNLSLDTDISSKTEKLKDITNNYDKKLNELQQENIRLNSKLSNDIAQKKADLQDITNNYDKKLSELTLTARNKNNELETEITNKESKIKDYDNKIKEYDNKITEYTNNITEYNNKINELKTHYNNKIKGLENDYKEKEEELKSNYNTKTQEFDAKYNSKKQQLDADYNSKEQKLDTDYNTKKQQLYIEYNNKKQQLDEEIETKTIKKNDLDSKITQLNNDKDRIEKENNAFFDELKKKKQKLQEEISKLQGQLTDNDKKQIQQQVTSNYTALAKNYCNAVIEDESNTIIEDLNTDMFYEIATKIKEETNNSEIAQKFFNTTYNCIKDCFMLIRTAEIYNYNRNKNPIKVDFTGLGITENDLLELQRHDYNVDYSGLIECKDILLNTKVLENHKDIIGLFGEDYDAVCKELNKIIPEYNYNDNKVNSYDRNFDIGL